MTSSFIQTEISLHQFLLHQPASEVGVVTVVIVKHATIPIEQVNSVTSCQSQGCAQGNDFVSPRSIYVNFCNTNIGAVYLKINSKKSGIKRFNSREIEMINPRDWCREDPGSQIERSALVDSIQFKRDHGSIRTKMRIPLDVEMNDFRLDVDMSNQFFKNCNRN